MRLSPKHAVVASAVVMAAVVGGSASASGSDSNDVPVPPAMATYDDKAAPTVSATSSHCEDAQHGESGAFYPGPAASALYESLFDTSFKIPHLDTHVPQGMTVWKDWNGHDTILVVAMYRKVSSGEKNSYLVAIDPDSGDHIATIEVAPGHLGGIGIAGKYLFGQDGDKPTPVKEKVRRYKLSRLADAFKSAAKSGKRPYLSSDGSPQTIAGAGYMQAYEGEIWAGHYNNSKTDKVYRYKVSSDGKLSVKESYDAPAKTQGILIATDRLIFNTSDGEDRGRMIVTNRKKDLDDATKRCFVTPSMGENMARIGDRVFVMYEGGSFKYPGAENRITHAHEADLAELRQL